MAGYVTLLKLAAWTNRKCHAIFYFKPIMVWNQSQYLIESSHLNELKRVIKQLTSIGINIPHVLNIFIRMKRTLLYNSTAKNDFYSYYMSMKCRNYSTDIFLFLNLSDCFYNLIGFCNNRHKIQRHWEWSMRYILCKTIHFWSFHCILMVRDQNPKTLDIG